MILLYNSVYTPLFFDTSFISYDMIQFNIYTNECKFQWIISNMNYFYANWQSNNKYKALIDVQQQFIHESMNHLILFAILFVFSIIITNYFTSE